MAMQKDGVIQIHMLLFQIKDELEHLSPDISTLFIEYDENGVFPLHINKSKKDHIKAVYILAEKIAKVFARNKYVGTGKTAERLIRLLKRLS